jgi:hypothetical protein
MKLLETLKGLVGNVKKRGLQDVINPDKWKVFYEGHEIEKNGLTIPYEDIIPFSEQIVYRMRQCPGCIKNGACLDCNCPMPLAMVTPNNWCSEGNWSEYMKGPEWEQHKIDMEIKI